ncbi:MAG: glycogen synthase GlgA [Ignavibacteria bacterium]|jgi:starch synthase
MKVAFVSSEVFPFAKTGGLADVAGSLPKELAKIGCEVKVFMPKYYPVNEYKWGHEYVGEIGEFKVRVGGWDHPVHLFKGLLPGSNVEIYFIHHPHYFHREKLYTNDWDEDERFILFQKAVIETLQRLNWAPDVINCNDWQTGLMPLFIKDNYNWDRMFNNTATVFTIHNIGYQGRFGTETLKRAEIAGHHYYGSGNVNFENSVSFMKAGIVFADVVSTVSETYAKEITTPEFAHGLHDIIRSRANDLYGILNGIDYDEWNPEKDKLIPFNFSSKYLSNKLKNKKELCQRFNLPFNESIPVVGIVLRMAPQKGFDIIEQTMPGLVNLDCQWTILGSGEWDYQEMFNSMHRQFPNKAGVYIGYENKLAHLIEAGADIFLMPSHYEPCGLNQMYSLKYGTVPVVRKTGGLADTVQDWDEINSYGMDIGDGFSFEAYEGYAMEHALKRAINYFHNKPVWRKIQSNGMNKDFTWLKSAEKYLELYERAVWKRKGI